MERSTWFIDDIANFYICRYVWKSAPDSFSKHLSCNARGKRWVCECFWIANGSRSGNRLPELVIFRFYAFILCTTHSAAVINFRFGDNVILFSSYLLVILSTNYALITTDWGPAMFVLLEPWGKSFWRNFWLYSPFTLFFLTHWSCDGQTIIQLLKS